MRKKAFKSTVKVSEVVQTAFPLQASSYVKKNRFVPYKKSSKKNIDYLIFPRPWKVAKVSCIYKRVEVPRAAVQTMDLLL